MNARVFVRVGVVFSKNGIRPVWFEKGHSQVKIEEVSYHWTERTADDYLHKFSVTDGLDTYELTLSSRWMRWTMNGI